MWWQNISCLILAVRIKLDYFFGSWLEYLVARKINGHSDSFLHRGEYTRWKGTPSLFFSFNFLDLRVWEHMKRSNKDLSSCFWWFLFHDVKLERIVSTILCRFILISFLPFCDYLSVLTFVGWMGFYPFNCFKKYFCLNFGVMFVPMCWALLSRCQYEPKLLFLITLTLLKLVLICYFINLETQKSKSKQVTIIHNPNIHR